MNYIAKVGIDFEGLKPPVRIEAGKKIPKLSEREIRELLASGLIEPEKEKEPKKEGK